MRAYLFFHPCTASCVHTCARIFYARGERERERASSKIGPTATACSLHVKRIQWTVNCALILIAAFIHLVITKATRVLPCFTLSRYILFAHDCSRCVKSRFISPRIPRIEVASLPFKMLLLFNEISLKSSDLYLFRLSVIIIISHFSSAIILFYVRYCLCASPLCVLS